MSAGGVSEPTRGASGNVTPRVVFISYSHDSDDHRRRVLGLSERLRRDGFETRLDRYVKGSPSMGWPRWMLNQLDDADWVLVVCTETYYRRFRGKERPGSGSGADFEGLLITQDLYDSRTNERFVPVLFSQSDVSNVPDPLRSGSRYVLTDEHAYQTLLDTMRGIAGIEPGPIGSVPVGERPAGALLRFGAVEDQPNQPDWPDEPIEVHWPMADHSQAREAFRGLLLRASPTRLLAVRGLSETGKSHMAIQMHANAAKIENLRCGSFNFKGTTNMGDEVRVFARHLELSMPDGNRLNEQLSGILDALRGDPRPTVLIFDTYEAAGDSAEWIERLLLHELVTARWLRVVILGQQVPEGTGQLWSDISSRPVDLSVPSAEDWYEYGCEHCDDQDLELDFVEKAHRRAGGRPAVLATLIRRP